MYNWTHYKEDDPEHFCFAYIKTIVVGGYYHEDFTKPVVWELDRRWNETTPVTWVISWSCVCIYVPVKERHNQRFIARNPRKLSRWNGWRSGLQFPRGRCRGIHMTINPA